MALDSNFSLIYIIRTLEIQHWTDGSCVCVCIMVSRHISNFHLNHHCRRHRHHRRHHHYNSKACSFQFRSVGGLWEKRSHFQELSEYGFHSNLRGWINHCITYIITRHVYDMCDQNLATKEEISELTHAIGDHESIPLG